MSEHHNHGKDTPCPSCLSRSIGRRRFARGLLASAGVAALAACAENPVTGRSNFGSIQDDVSSTPRAAFPATSPTSAVASQRTASFPTSATAGPC
jgi:hypothetical protein